MESSKNIVNCKVYIGHKAGEYHGQHKLSFFDLYFSWGLGDLIL